MKKIKLYDCCIYNGEWMMLNFRLHELNEVVDKFIIVESAHTFSGLRKDRPTLDVTSLPFQDKIVHKVLDESPDPDAWQNEYRLRDFCLEGLRDIELYDHDILVCSDVDEIPDPADLRQVRESGIGDMSSMTCLQNFYYYNTYTMKRKKSACTRITSVKNFTDHYNKSFYKLRVDARQPSGYFGSEGDFTSGGWHFSYFGDIDFIIDKINSFSHQEFNTLEYKDPARIKQAIEEGKDVFFRGPQEDMDIDYNRTYLPKHINLLTTTTK
jgi:beta-1,4-mannosyl-glycoprotein beta-1,4-N-acetylglucosaminyltransferase